MKSIPIAALCVLLLGQQAFSASSSASDEANKSSRYSWARGVAYVVGGVGIVAMVVSGEIVRQGLQESCTAGGIEGEPTCEHNEGKVETGLQYMGVGALVAVGAIATLGVIELIERSEQSSNLSATP